MKCLLHVRFLPCPLHEIQVADIKFTNRDSGFETGSSHTALPFADWVL